MGLNEGTITKSYSTGRVESSVGAASGFVGINKGGTISSSYSSVDVKGKYSVAGFTLSNDGLITNSYSSGDLLVTNDPAYYIAGFVLFNHFHDTGIIQNSYSTSSLSHENPDMSKVNMGGFSANYTGEMENVFFDQSKNPTINAFSQYAIDDKSIDPSVYEPTAKTTEELQTLSTFSDAGWDIEEDSSLSSDYKYPVLSSFNGGGSTTWKIYTEPTPTPAPDPTPDSTPTPDTDPTPTPDPTPEPSVEQEAVDVNQVIITIANQEATRVSKVDLPIAKDLSTSPIDSVANIVETTPINTLISQPIEGQGTKRVSMSEAKAMQIESGGGDGEVRVPLSRDSMIELVDGGVSLPEGVEQEFYVADEEE